MRVTVFLSYSRADRETADVIEDLLRRHGIGCWIDHRGIRLGERFDLEIERAILRSGAVVWLVSSESVQNNYVKYEVTTALNHRRPVLPVRLEPIDLLRLPAPLNLKLGSVQAWDYFASPPGDLGAGLADGLRRLVLRDRRKALVRLGASAAALGLAGTSGLWWVATHGRTGPAPAPPPRPIPQRLTGLPFADVLRIIYTESPPAPASATARAALQIDLEARRHGEREFTRLKDGDTLTSRVDDYRVVAKAPSPGYLYLFQVDAAGKIDWLFPRNATSPLSHGSNPLVWGQSIQMPSAESGSALYLDTIVGVEHVYAVFSATRWARLEGALARPLPAGEELPPLEETSRGVVESPNALGLRGVGGVRPVTSPGDVSGSSSVGERFQGDGYFLVLERWFRHVGL